MLFDCTKMEFQMFNPVFKHLFVCEFRGCIPFSSFSKLFWLYLQNIPWICLFLFMSTLVSATAFSHLGYFSRLLTGFLLLFSHSWFPKGPEGFFKKINQIMSFPSSGAPCLEYISPAHLFSLTLYHISFKKSI